MIPHRFTYRAPASLAGVLDALADDPDGTVLLAGGSWVVPSLDRGDRVARQVLDLRRAGLGGIDAAGDRVRVGACATYADLLASPLLPAVAPVLPVMAAGVTGGPQIVGRGTVGGSVAAARPGSDAPAVLALLGAVAEVAGPAGTRTVDVSALWVGAFRTCLGPDEVLVAFHFGRVPAGTGCGYVKLKHGTGSWPIVTAAATLTLDERGACRAVALVIGGACAVPFAVPLDTILLGHPPDDIVLRAAADAAGAAVTEAWDDELAPAAYRAAVVPAAARRALAAALADARPTAPDRETS